MFPRQTPFWSQLTSCDSPRKEYTVQPFCCQGIFARRRGSGAQSAFPTPATGHSHSTQTTNHGEGRTVQRKGTPICVGMPWVPPNSLLGPSAYSMPSSRGPRLAGSARRCSMVARPARAVVRSSSFPLSLMDSNTCCK